jgi:hypothetical protein
MNPHLRNALEVIAFIVVVALIWIAVPVQAHSVDCAGRGDIDQARFESHRKMAETCGPLTGEEHLACNRAFLIAQPLDCKPLSAEDAGRCAAVGDPRTFDVEWTVRF